MAKKRTKEITADKITNYYFIIVFLIIPKFPALVDFTVAKSYWQR
jgi:hypothetical protein